MAVSAASTSVPLIGIWRPAMRRLAGRPRRLLPVCGWQHCRRLSDGYPAWRQVLADEPKRKLGSWGELHVTGDMSWSDNEYGHCSHSDGRIRKRIASMGRAWETSPGERLPGLFSGAAERKAAYRLLSNPWVTMKHVVDGHLASTVERCDGGECAKGIVPHVGLAVTESRRPPSLFHLDASFRRVESKDSQRWLRRWRVPTNWRTAVGRREW